MRAWRILLFVGIPLVAGLTATVLALNARHAGDAFSADQKHLQPYNQRSAVEKLVGTAPTPTSPAANGKATASCLAGRQGPLQNPWTCTLHYARSGLTLRYAVTINNDGSYFGRGRREKNGLTDTIHGCCLPSS